MSTIRRVYIYLALSVALILVLAGLPDLLRIAFEQAGRGSLDLSRVARDDLSRALAFACVGGVLWAVHARLATGLVRGEGPEADAERGSVARAVLLTGTIVVLGAAAAWTGAELARALLREAFGYVVFAWERADVARLAATLIVFLGALLPYLRWRIADHRSAPERLADDVATRVALYGGLAVFGSLALVTLRDLAEPALRMLVDLPPAGLAGPRWWADPVAMAAAAFLVTVPTWLALRLLADRIVATDGAVAAAHRVSRMRAAQLHAVTAVGITLVVAGVATGLGALGAWLAGAGLGGTATAEIAEIAGPVLVVLPVAAGGLWHAVRARADAWAALGPAGAGASVRCSVHLLALGGLAALAGGLVRLIVLTLEPAPIILGDVIAGGGAGIASVMAAAGVALAGLLAWAPAWTWLERDRAADPLGRAGSLVRRGALAATLGTAGVAAAAATAIVLYRLFRTLLSASSIGDASETTSIAVLVVTLVILPYHAAVLWRDLRIARAAAPSAEAPGALAEELDLQLPADTDLVALNARIRALLPPGSAMRVRRGSRA